MTSSDSSRDFQDPQSVDEAAKGAARDRSVRDADPGPVDDPDAQAEAEGLSASEDTAEHYREMLDKGANQQGEGRVP